MQKKVNLVAIQAQKGTKDILPPESEKWQYIEELAKEIFNTSNYNEIRTPIFEATELFERGVGDSTDIVNKEMYTFSQKDRNITLRPENTAGVVRAFIEHGMHRLPSPVKLWYKGPMFRYERPQAGRQRQFHQIGVELFGINEPSADAEVILVAMNYLKKLNIPDLSLEINSLGCPECRNTFREKLKEAIKPNLDKYCPDCHLRFEKNPLRILDCKSPECQNLIAFAEVQNVIKSDYICKNCSEHFNLLKEQLDFMGINYEINKLLVRGLDYYNRTVFEIKSNALGSQNAVCGGGRYDNLVEMLGGPATPAVGWAMGMERLLVLMPKIETENIDVFVVSNMPKEALKLADEIRNLGLKTDFDMTNKKFGKQFDKASKLNAKFAVVLGEEELKENKLTVKNLSSGEQSTLETKVALTKLRTQSKD
jgi:histidyl-tRNA synthetase